MQIEKMKLADLNPAPYNPRKISPENLAALKQSITKFGLVEPLIVNKRTGNLVGGHQRLKVLQEQGATETDVVVVDLPEIEEKALNVALNSPTVQGQFTDDIQQLLSQIRAEFPILSDELNFTPLEVDFSPVGVETQGKLDEKEPIVCPKCGHEFTP